jgi:PAS domain S-box-containing protein
MREIRGKKTFTRTAASASRTSIHERQLLRQIATLEAALKQQQQQQQDHARLTSAIRRFQELVDLAPISFLTLDRRCRIVDLNQNAARLLGFQPEWLRKRPFLVFIAQGAVRHFLDILSAVREVPDHPQVTPLELWLNERPVPVQIWIKSSTGDDQMVYSIAIFDLTETKIIETELKEALNNWYSLVENAPDIIMTVDQRGKIRFVNREAWGRLPSELSGTLLVDYMMDKDRKKVERCITETFAGYGASCELAGINGERKRWYSFSFGPVKRAANEKGDKTTTITIRDISDQKRTEESLRASREELREFAARLDSVREDERTRVAREIHDELGQALTILKMDLAWLQGTVGRYGNGSRKKIKSMIGDVDQTIDRVRKIVTDLRPSILDELGLTAALEWQVNQFQERTGIRGLFHTSSDDFRLSKDVSAALFRVVQEALTNVVRHSGAKEVRVALKSIDNALRISIADDGKGITRLQIDNRRSFGIVGMRERVHRIGGALNIFSVPGRGTRLEISIPLK